MPAKKRHFASAALKKKDSLKLEKATMFFIAISILMGKFLTEYIPK